MTNTKKDDRRVRALARLEAQLESGVKTSKGKNVNSQFKFDRDNAKEPLTEKDIKRINREIEILKQK